MLARPRRFFLVLLTLTLPFTGCKGPQATSPEGAAKAFVRAVASGNGKEIFKLLTPAMQARLSKAAKLATAQAGTRRRVKPHELLAASLAKPKHKLFSVKVVSQKGDRARVKLSDAEDKNSEVWSMVRVKGTWRIELPANSMPPPQRTPHTPASQPASAPAGSQPSSAPAAPSQPSGSGTGTAPAPR